MKGNLMLSMLGVGLGGVSIPIIKTAFSSSIESGCYTIICCICLFISAGYFAMNSMED